MMHNTPWPPPGGMSLIFSQLVYVDYFGVGGHGGVGIHADREQRNNEIVAMVSRHVNPSSYFLMNIDRITDNDRSQTSRSMKKSATLIRSSQFYQNSTSNMFLNEIPPNRNYFQSNSSRFRNTVEGNRPSYRGTNISMNNLNTNSNNGENTEISNQELVRPKCIICSLL